VNQYKPSAAVLIDLPDFNLKLASHLHQSGIPVIYYISPQIWAWRQGRIHDIKKFVRKMLVVFDFEEELYRKAGVDVTFVGHPLLDVVDQTPVEKNGLEIGLLPASRKEQFKRLYPVIKRTADLIRDRIPSAKFTIALAPGIDPHMVPDSEIKVCQGRSHDVMKKSTLLITASGTATVEAVIFETPMIVAYKVSAITAFLARRFTKLRNFSMVNILAGREVVPEFFQKRAKPELISSCAIDLIEKQGLIAMREELKALKPRLGTPGASLRAAEEILKIL
jgi:lipid-A-disaccharide synthase